MDFLIDTHSHTHTNKHIHIHTRVLYVNQEWKMFNLYMNLYTHASWPHLHTHSFTLFAATLSSHLTNSNTRLHSFIRLRSTWTQTHTYAYTYLHTFTHWMHQAHAHSLDHSSHTHLIVINHFIESNYILLTISQSHKLFLISIVIIDFHVDFGFLRVISIE